MTLTLLLLPYDSGGVHDCVNIPTSAVLEAAPEGIEDDLNEQVDQLLGDVVHGLVLLGRE